MISLLLATALALAAPPSSTLTGPDGELSWQIRSTAEGVHIDGTSPKWTVEHQAGPDLSPRHTVHRDDDNGEVVIDYSATAAEITRRGKTWTVEQAGLWDGDTLDVRLGAEVAAGRADQAFSVVDPSSGKVYDLDSATVGQESCAGAPCTQVRVQLTGLLRRIGPTWRYWFASDGKLVRFEGPAGTFALDPAK